MTINKKISSFLFAAVVTSMTTFSSSAAEKAPGSGPNPFSDCGIGAALFDNDVLAVISNVIWDVGTTAVTSAVSSPETCNGKDVKTAAFIFDSYENLEEDTARGQGEHLVSVLNLMQCNASSHTQISADIRADFADSLNNTNYTSQSRVQKAEGFYHIVMKNSAASQQCG